MPLILKLFKKSLSKAKILFYLHRDRKQLVESKNPNSDVWGSE